MAKATVVTPPVERVISLELTEKEAAFIYYITASTVIGPDEGPRGLSNAIYEALQPLGLSTAAIRSALRGNGTLKFGHYAGSDL